MVIAAYFTLPIRLYAQFLYNGQLVSFQMR